MGNISIKGGGSEANQPQTELNLILKTMGNQVNLILQNQTKNLEKIIVHQGQMIRQSLKEQTNYLKVIAENTKLSTQFSQTNIRDIKCKTSQKSIQLTDQSSNVSLPSKQFIQSKECLQIKESPEQNQFQKKQKQIIKQKESNKINEMLTSIPQLCLQKSAEIHSKLQKIQMTFKSKNELHLQKKDPILFINKNSNQLQKTLALELLDKQEKSKVNIDYKDRFLVMPLIKYDKHQKLNMIDPWISDLYEELSEEAFYGYLHKHMTKDQMKVFYSQNLILNTVKMIKSLIEKNQQISVKQILKKFGKVSGPALEFQLKKYPQKKKILLKSQIQNMVQQCQIHQDPQYDILNNMDFNYQYEQNGVYYKQIKQMLNKIISQTNKNFQQFQKQMKKIFTLKFEKQIPEYIQHQIGRKINQNTPQFQEHQINSNKISIQSPEIMRIIVKWIQELEDKINIQKLEKNIDNRYYPFLLKDGGQVQYSKQVRQKIRKSFKQFLSKSDQNNKFVKNLEMLQNIESQIINYINTNSKSFTYLSQISTEVGLTTHLLSETVQEITIKRLNQIIHSILSFQYEEQEKRDRKQYKNVKDDQYFCEVSYITFSIYDLLRSRCTGSYQKIKIVYDQLKKNTNFKIIRVKNRLSTGNRDFLINMRFKDTAIICELQLGLILEKSSINQKQERLGDFNHFLYELKRSKYGPLTQAVILNAHHSETITFFQEKLKKSKFEKERKIKISTIKPKICNGEIQISGYDIQQQKIIFVCHNCLQVKSTKTSFLNTYKKMKQHKEDQFQYFCGECIINSLQVSDRDKYLLGEYIDQYFQQTNYDQMLENSQMLEYKFSYFLIISNDRRYIVKRLDKDYFVQSFSNLLKQKYQFLNINQLGIKYVYRLAKWIDDQKVDNKWVEYSVTYIDDQAKDQQISGQQVSDQQVDVNQIDDQQIDVNLIDNQQIDDSQNDDQQFDQQVDQSFDYQIDQKVYDQEVNDSDYIIRIHNIQELNKRKYINQQKKQFLRKNQTNWKQAVCIKGKNGSWRLIDATKEQKGKDYQTRLNLFIKTKKIKKFKQQKIEYMDLGCWGLNQEFFKKYLKEVKQIKKLNLSENNLKDIKQIVKGKNILELNINNNELENVDLSNLINLQKLDISCNHIENIHLDNLVKLKQLNLSDNQLKELTLTNQQCQKLYLYKNKLVKLDISKMKKIKQLNIDENGFKQLVLKNSQLQRLDMSNNQQLKVINIQKLFNLKLLNMANNGFQNLTLNNVKLFYLCVSNNKLNSVNFKALVNLIYLYLSSNKLKQLSLDNPLLQILDVDNNKLQNLDISKLVNLSELNASKNKLTQFPQRHIKFLNKLELNNNKLKKINLNGYTNLREVDISYNLIHELIVDNLLELQILKANHNKIKKVDITKLIKIRHINFNYNKIQQIVLRNESLQTVYLHYNRIQNIDLDKLRNLRQLDISNNCITILNITKQNNPKLKKICINNQKSRYEKYFIEKLLTEQEMVRYKQQKQKTQAEKGQSLIKLGFYKIATEETFSKIIDSIHYQYDNKVDIIDLGKQS